ncbi:CSC1-like protein RXW8 isoform X2 [Cryptomeria japonica]|uniref:CSC1-like protein RXW8 isoform X2 n=1 Tax=Cryptomeria japonica TaxID=3369 RepID=UPI0027DA9279|nr:CSC1-like protein RXW8 isoform X2 [Cryptomeria japonica]
MNIAALMTSAGINIALCILFLCLYSILRKQPSNFSVYFPRKLAEEQLKKQDSFSLDRLIPSAGWIMKAWETSEEDILAYAGLDALVFIRIFVFSIRIFGISALLCIFVLLPINYTSAKFQPGDFSRIASESLDIFTILHIPGGSKRLWAHVFALYVITGAACFLLYFEYKHIAERRLAVFNNSLPRPNHFTILVRGIPISDKNSLSDTVERFFTQYYPLTYHSHQMIYRTGRVQALMDDAEKIYKKIVHFKSQNNFQRQAHPVGCLGLCGRKMDPLDLYTKKLELVERNARHGNSDHFQEAKELPAAFVSFKSRISATVAAQVRQSSNPMLWMTELAPEPEDVYWSNLSIPCRQLWFRKIVVLLGSIALSFVFFIPVAFVQGLSQLDQLQRYFPFLHKVLRTKFASQFITGYLPSVIQQLFMYTIPPIMMFFSAIQGCVSYSGKKKSACAKMIYFSVWNLFFVNVLSGSVIGQINTIISNPKELPNRLAKQVPIQVLNVYCYKYDTGGQYWPVVHNGTIFSLILTQVIALGVFGVKKFPLASGLMVPLIVFSLLFNEYCRQRFYHIFENYSAEILIDKDREDDQSGQLDNFLETLDSKYLHPTLQPVELSDSENNKEVNAISEGNLRTSMINYPLFRIFHLSRLKEIYLWLSMTLSYQERRVSK